MKTLIQTKIYYHRDQEGNFDLADEIKLNKTAIENGFLWMGSEVNMTILVDKETGETHCTHLNDVALEKPVLLWGE